VTGLARARVPEFGESSFEFFGGGAQASSVVYAVLRHFLYSTSAEDWCLPVELGEVFGKTFDCFCWC
jgi:hypothetical protein